MPIPPLCHEFAEILQCTPGLINGVCLATRSRSNIHPTVLGRKAESFMFVPQGFSFESMDAEGRALCLGETVLLEEEVNPFMSKLREQDIIVTAFHNHWLFDEPRLMYMHFESIDHPIIFAKKVRNALDILITESVNANNTGIKGENVDLSSLCQRFNAILGGTMHTFENGVCTVMRSRTNIKPTVLGREGRSFLLIPEMYLFESVSANGIALCSGEVSILEEEINPFISRLRKNGIFVTAVHNHWLFDNPRLMYMHFVLEDHPLHFAAKVHDALRVLTTREVRPS